MFVSKLSLLYICNNYLNEISFEGLNGLIISLGKEYISLSLKEFCNFDINMLKYK